MNLNVIDGTTVRPQVGGLFDWLKTAAGNVDSVIQTVQPVIQDAKSTFGSSSTGIVSPTQTQLNPQQSISTWEGQQLPQSKPNNTLLYVGLAVAGLAAIFLLKNK